MIKWQSRENAPGAITDYALTDLHFSRPDCSRLEPDARLQSRVAAARCFHDILGVCMTIAFSLTGLWLLWKKSSDFLIHLFVAASVPVIAWVSFFIVVLVPGVEGHPGALAASSVCRLIFLWR